MCNVHFQYRKCLFIEVLDEKTENVFFSLQLTVNMRLYRSLYSLAPY